MTTQDEFLSHYGISGMKWGKHKAESTSAVEPYSSRGYKVGKAVTKTVNVAGVATGVALLGTMALGAIYINAFHTPAGIAKMTKGAEFIAKRANTPYSQAVVMKGAKLLDARLGLR